MPLSWSTKRQFFFLSIITIIFIAVFFGFFFSPSAPSCIDGKQNQDEEGIDCGGGCSVLCIDSLNELTILWSRALPAGNNIYDAAAFVENTNINAGVSRIAYRFKLYDNNNLLVTERAGTTFINSNERFMIFEGNIRVGNRVPKRAFLEFEKTPLWEKVFQTPPPLEVRQTNLTENDGTTRLSAVVANRSPDNIFDIVFTVSLVDENGNVFAASKTELNELLGGEEITLFFTWPRLFEKIPAQIIVSPRIRAL